MSAAPDADTLRALYRRMLLIRAMEEALGAAYKAGELPAGVHLTVGQEAIPAGVCAHLADTDWITSTHRGHGHFLAKGGDPAAMAAEIYGRASGVCGGYGGTMHVADVARGILGANGIVGGGLGIATGAAFAAQLDGRGAVAACFFGDGAANQGTLMEAMNLASLWRLPLVLVCENNGWSEFSATETVTSGVIAERARPFCIPAERIDGNDVAAVWRAAGAAIARARSGGGPSLIEAETYRLRGHVEAEVNFLSSAYRTQADIDAWTPRDPLARARAALLALGLPEAALAADEADARAQTDAAMAHARAAPEPQGDAEAVRMMMPA